MKKERFDITGMSCAACSARVNKAVEKLDGVKDVAVNLLKNSMTVLFDDSVVTAENIARAVGEAGYGATLAGEKATPEHKGGDDRQALKSRLILSAVLLAVLMYVTGFLRLPVPECLAGERNIAVNGLTQLLLTAAVVFINADYYKKGIKNLYRFAPNMDSLIALGSGAAVVFSVAGLYKTLFALERGQVLVTGGALYFESAAMILTLITLGRFLEARAKGKTAEAIAGLMALVPPVATVQRDGAEIQIPADSLAVGDVIVVKTGEKIAADGVIVDGKAYVDESALTGESRLVEKKAGDTVLTACLVKSGHFIMRAQQVGQDTALAQIVRLVDEATSSKAPIARMADKVSGVFVPVVIGAAFITVAVWLMVGAAVDFALSAGIAVLVISCPCALGLATPTAIMVGTGRGAKKGVLFKSAAALEMTGRIDTVALDKTGTLTQGVPVVTDVLTADGVAESDLLRAAASLEKLSEHALGAAIVAKACEAGLSLSSVTDFAQTAGEGVSGRIDGVLYRIGNVKMAESAGIFNTLREQGEALAEQAKTPLYVMKENALAGIIAVADKLKDGSVAAVKALKKAGLQVVLLTGDNAKTAAAIGKEAGIDTIVSDMLPQDKEAEIRRLQAEGKKVMMVGDGINDAPALARADVGVAVGDGTDIAIDSADVVLMKNDLNAVVFGVSLGRAVLANIKENLFWAFFYNAVGIPVAAGVLYPAFGVLLSPVIAAAAMSFSSFSVVTNALRLRYFTIEKKVKRSVKMKKEVMIEGMHCQHCAASAAKALQGVDGVAAAVVDLAAKKAAVELTKDVADAALMAAVDDAGFQAVSVKKI